MMSVAYRCRTCGHYFLLLPSPGENGEALIKRARMTPETDCTSFECEGIAERCPYIVACRYCGAKITVDWLTANRVSCLSCGRLVNLCAEADNG
jgi:DNA-directed RNA polymerase subunit RPC12/RpoP